MELGLEPVALRLREPVRAAWGVLERRELLRVRLRDQRAAGTGEAAPLPGYDRVTLAAVRAELEALPPEALRAPRERGLPRLALPHARAGLDLAAWDLEGRRAGRPVAELLAERWPAEPSWTADRPGEGPSGPSSTADRPGERPSGPSSTATVPDEGPLTEVPVNALVTAEDRAGAATQAAAAAAAGLRCVKVKVGIGDDAGRLAAVRAAVGPDVAVRVDANGAWTVEEAIAALDALAPVGIELCEEPVHGVEELRSVREAVEVPIAMDETARDPAALASGAADAVCLRIGAHGGISGVLEAAAAARAAGSDVYLASTFDGPAGIAAALHAAAALGVERACGLATLALFDLATDPLPPRDGAIAVPAGPGLGIDPQAARSS